jgi:hypothetical protein
MALTLPVQKKMASTLPVQEENGIDTFRDRLLVRGAIMPLT